MKFAEAVRYIEGAGKYGSKLGLTRMRDLMEQLDNPQDELRFIHIAGTNGKGSVLAYIASVLKASGYKTGSYSSPAVENFREHFQINGVMISKKQYAKCVEKLQAAAERMQEAGKQCPTLFELETALGFLYFKENRCDVVVLETGLGGSLDATNIIGTTVLSVITSISMDHAELLGNTLEEIAEQKAGIIKDHVPVVMLENTECITNVIKRKCRITSSELFIAKEEKLRDVVFGFPAQKFSYYQFANARISLGGIHQIMNAALAIEAFWSLRNSDFFIPAAKIREGLKAARWPYRMEQILKKPQFIVDGAHNPDAAQRLADSLQLYFGERTLIFIIGVFKDKDYQKICEVTAGMARHIITVQTPDSARALSAEALQAAVKKYNPAVEPAGSLQLAVKRSLEMAARYRSEKPLIVAFGSLAYLAGLKRIVDKEVKNNH